MEISCGCGGGSVELRNGQPPRFSRRVPAERRRDYCCPECAQGIESFPAGAGFYGPAGAGVLARGANESEADFNRRVEAQARAEREIAAADRDAALRGVQTATGTFTSAFSQAQETERARIAAEAAQARSRSESTAAIERARIEAARDLELARIRGVQPEPSNLSVMPVEAVSTRTDSGAQTSKFPTMAVVGVVGVAGAIYLLTRGKGSSGGGRRRKGRR